MEDRNGWRLGLGCRGTVGGLGCWARRLALPCQRCQTSNPVIRCGGGGRACGKRHNLVHDSPVKSFISLTKRESQQVTGNTAYNNPANYRNNLLASSSISVKSSVFQPGPACFCLI